jgi:hypothetical protein
LAVDRSRNQQSRRALSSSTDEIVAEEVRDALAASPEERKAAAVALLDAAYALWASTGMTDDPGLCRFPGCVQERRRLVPGDREGGGAAAASTDDT